jgi:hypothetical protein
LAHGCAGSRKRQSMIVGELRRQRPGDVVIDRCLDFRGGRTHQHRSRFETLPHFHPWLALLLSEHIMNPFGAKISSGAIANRRRAPLEPLLFTLLDA